LSKSSSSIACNGHVGTGTCTCTCTCTCRYYRYCIRVQYSCVFPVDYSEVVSPEVLINFFCSEESVLPITPLWFWFCGPWLQRYGTLSTFSWCKILFILPTLCYSIQCDYNTRAFSPALLTKIFTKNNWFFSVYFLLLQNAILVSVRNLSWSFMPYFADSLLIRVLTCITLNLPCQFFW
jgi:hypothetical protein